VTEVQRRYINDAALMAVPGNTLEEIFFRRKPMLRLLIDQDLDHDILRGLIRRIPRLDAVTAFEIGLSEANDPQLISRAAQDGRIIVTHDRKTMPTHAAELMGTGKDIAGLFVVPRSLSLREAIEDLELMITCSGNDEWVNVIRYLPF
jgi:hypothetical protein